MIKPNCGSFFTCWYHSSGGSWDRSSGSIIDRDCVKNKSFVRFSRKLLQQYRGRQTHTRHATTRLCALSWSVFNPYTLAHRLFTHPPLLLSQSRPRISREVRTTITAVAWTSNRNQKFSRLLDTIPATALTPMFVQSAPSSRCQDEGAAIHELSM